MFQTKFADSQSGPRAGRLEGLVEPLGLYSYYSIGAEFWLLTPIGSGFGWLLPSEWAWFVSPCPRASVGHVRHLSSTKVQQLLKLCYNTRLNNPNRLECGKCINARVSPLIIHGHVVLRPQLLDLLLRSYANSGNQNKKTDFILLSTAKPGR